MSTLSPNSKALEDRVYQRWKPNYPFYVRPPVIIAIPARGRVCTVSCADAMQDPAALDRRFREIARLAFGEA